MKLTYDPRYNIAYLRSRKKATRVETISISDELNIDLGPDGRIYGIEFLNANEQLKAIDSGKLIYKDETTGKQVAVAI